MENPEELVMALAEAKVVAFEPSYGYGLVFL